MHPSDLTRRHLLALSTLAAAAGLSACGAGDSSSAGTTLKLMFWGDPQARETWRGITEAFRAAGHQDVEFELLHQPDEYETKLQTLIAANDAPDVFMLNTNATSMFASAGALLDLTPHLDALGVDLEEEFIDVSVWREEDAVLALSALVDSVVCYYDKAAFDEAGLAYPPSDAGFAWTWEEFAQTAQALSGGSGNDARWGAFITYNPIPWTPLVVSNGGSWYDEDVSTFTLGEPEAVEVFQAIRALIDSGAAVPSDSVSSLGWDIVLQSRRAAMFLEGTWNTRVVGEAWGQDAGMAVLPSFGEFTSMSITDQFAASTQTSNPELAAEFIHFAAQAQNNPNALLRAPAARAYFEGAERETWLSSEERPEGFEETLDSSLSSTFRMPGTQTTAQSQIEPLVMDEAITPYLTGESDDIAGLLGALRERADKLLSES